MDSLCISGKGHFYVSKYQIGDGGVTSFFLSFFFYLSRVQKRSRYGEAVTGTGNNALYRKQNYDRGSPKEEQFLNGVHLKSLISI